MVQQQNHAQHCRWQSLIIGLNAEYAWGLDMHTIQTYVCDLARYVPENCSDSDLQRVCRYYHQDHEFVEILKQAQHPAHNEYWHVWMLKISDVLRKAHLLWSSDIAVDSDDLHQIAMMALSGSLSSFAYRSSFSTWTHTVVIQSVQRYIRDSNAKKRAKRPESLDALTSFDTPAPDQELPETQAAYQQLITMIHSILEGEENERLALIFQLSLIEDRTTEDIGALVHLHPSRVRALLAKAKLILQQHLEIREWLMAVDFSSDEGIIS